MAAPRLRVYYGPEHEPQVRALPESESLRSTVTVPLGDVLNVLTDAVRNRRAWVQDFEDDEITIPDQI